MRLLEKHEKELASTREWAMVNMALMASKYVSIQNAN